MENIPFYLTAAFIFIILFALLFFYRATGNAKKPMVILLTWMIIQAALSISGFYAATATRLPHFPLMVIPPVVGIIILFNTRSGRSFIDNLDGRYLTLLHVVRIPVEFILFLLALQKVIPTIMTFEGRNADILSGIGALVVYFWVYVKRHDHNRWLLLFNVAGLILLMNIMVIAILSLPAPFQQFAFDQPNRAVLYFPFSWLPSLIVPLVLFAHLVMLRRLLRMHSGKSVFKQVLH